MLNQVRMKKAKQSVFGVIMEGKDRNGESYISTKQKVHKPKDLTKTSDSMLTDHSILFQSFHSIELLSATVQTMSG